MMGYENSSIESDRPRPGMPRPSRWTHTASPNILFIGRPVKEQYFKHRQSTLTAIIHQPEGNTIDCITSFEDLLNRSVETYINYDAIIYDLRETKRVKQRVYEQQIKSLLQITNTLLIIDNQRAKKYTPVEDERKLKKERRIYHLGVGHKVRTVLNILTNVKSTDNR